MATIDMILESWKIDPERIPSGKPHFQFSVSGGFLLTNNVTQKIHRAEANAPIPNDGTKIRPDCSGDT